jgi:hypothetical protein
VSVAGKFVDVDHVAADVDVLAAVDVYVDDAVATARTCKFRQN